MAQRRKREREAPEIGDMLARMTRALARRAGAGEVEALHVLAALREQIDDALAAGIDQAHTFGYSFATIGEELGITRQAAHQAAERHKRKAQNNG